jgi:hypothetical protein
LSTHFWVNKSLSMMCTDSRVLKRQNMLVAKTKMLYENLLLTFNLFFRREDSQVRDFQLAS